MWSLFKRKKKMEDKLKFVEGIEKNTSKKLPITYSEMRYPVQLSEKDIQVLYRVLDIAKKNLGE